MFIQNLVLIGPFVFKILSKNSILTSIKGSNSVANLLKFELIQAFMHVLLMDVVTCKYEEDPIKNEGARVDTTLYSNFSDAQWQITLVLVSLSGRNLNSSKLSCMSLLPARRRMIKSKMKELECSQDFSHYKSMGIFPDAQGQLTPQSLVRSGRISNSSEMLWMFLLPASMKKIQSKTRTVRGSDYSPAVELSKQKDKLVTENWRD